MKKLMAFIALIIPVRLEAQVWGCHTVGSKSLVFTDTPTIGLGTTCQEVAGESFSRIQNSGKQRAGYEKPPVAKKQKFKKIKEKLKSEQPAKKRKAAKRPVLKPN